MGKLKMTDIIDIHLEAYKRGLCAHYALEIFDHIKICRAIWQKFVSE